MRTLLVAFAFAGTLMAGAAQAPPVPASGSLLADNPPLAHSRRRAATATVI